ncbi:MAG TPA: ABC transporter permease [Bryobacteraceae bacterium]|jgi:predicted permease|nr:ABC transporter permease [Bryobacteraceae bacterium]
MSLWSRLRRTFRPEQHSREIEEELAYHLAMKEQDAAGARAARVRFGNRTKLREETRAQDVLMWLESLTRDVRYGLRQIGRNRGLSAVVILSLALGIGANSAIFSIVDAALLKPLPVKDPQTLRAIWWKNHGWPDPLCTMMNGDSEGDFNTAMRGSSVSVRAYHELAKEPGGFTAIVGAGDPGKVSVTSGRRPAERFSLQYVSANFFRELGVEPRLGRSFRDSEDRSGAAPVVVISDRFWRGYFGGRTDVLGQVLRVNNVPVEVIGVAPEHFFGVQVGEWVDLYAPLSAQVLLDPRDRLNADLGEKDTYWWVRLIGRLAPGMSEAQAVGMLSARFQHAVAPAGIRVDQKKVPKLFSLPGARGFAAFGGDDGRALWVLLLLVGLVLLIVCANVANLLLSRAVARQRESAVCLALGAARFRLLRQYLIESMLLAFAGGALGLLLSRVLADGVHSFIRANLGIGGFDLHTDWRILLFTMLVSVLTALLFGSAPALQLMRASINDVLKAGSRTVLSGRLRLPRMLVAIEVALGFVVLAGAGLLTRSLVNLEHVDIGFDRQNLIYVSIDPWAAGYQSGQVKQYVERLRAQVAELPGVRRVAIIQSRPFSGSMNMTTVNAPGLPFARDQEHSALLNMVSDGLFETMGIPLIAGTTFKPADLKPDSGAVIVDEQFAKHFFPGRNPIGQRFGESGPALDPKFRIVGVVKNNRYNSLRESARPTFYQPLSVGMNPGAQINLVLRTGLPESKIAPEIYRAAAQVDRAVPVTEIKTQNALIDHLLLMERLLSILSAAFGALALLLCAIGLAGLLAYTVARRTNEIGVRMALGASARQVIGFVVRQCFGLVVLGVVIGVPGAFLLGRALRNSLFGLTAADPVSLGLSLAALLVCAGLAAWLPSLRAARIDPMSALREE